MASFSVPTLDVIVKEMKAVGEVLMPFNFPQVPFNAEDDLSIFKARHAVIDGYRVFVHYQKSDYGEYLIETLQINNSTAPFLPFQLICKLGKRFLGHRHLSLIEFFKENRKIYVWSVCMDRKGSPVEIPNVTRVEPCEFEGFKYSYLQPSQVDFF